MRTTEQVVRTRDTAPATTDAADMTAITDLSFVDEDDEIALHRTPWAPVLVCWVGFCAMVSATSLWIVAR